MKKTIIAITKKLLLQSNDGRISRKDIYGYGPIQMVQIISNLN